MREPRTIRACFSSSDNFATGEGERFLMAAAPFAFLSNLLCRDVATAGPPTAAADDVTDDSLSSSDWLAASSGSLSLSDLS